MFRVSSYGSACSTLVSIGEKKKLDRIEGAFPGRKLTGVWGIGFSEQ